MDTGLLLKRSLIYTHNGRLSDGRSVIVSEKGGQLHFRASIDTLVFTLKLNFKGEFGYI